MISEKVGSFGKRVSVSNVVSRHHLHSEVCAVSVGKRCVWRMSSAAASTEAVYKQQLAEGRSEAYAQVGISFRRRAARLCC